MKKPITFLLACVLSLGCLAGCGEANTDILGGLKDDVVYLDYSTGFDKVGNYNTELYALNQTDTIGGDPGAIYVPKERSAEYGGYYYVYTTSSTKQLFGWDSDNHLEGYDDDVEALAVRCFRSKDLCSWELAGSEHGYSIIGRKGDWEEWTLRVPCAPEIVYNENNQKYYMYYNMISKLNDEGELKRREGETAAADKLSYPRSDRNYVGIAVSDNPCGPFTALSREETVQVADGAFAIDGAEVDAQTDFLVTVHLDAVEAESVGFMVGSLGGKDDGNFKSLANHVMFDWRNNDDVKDIYVHRGSKSGSWSWDSVGNDGIFPCDIEQGPATLTLVYKAGVYDESDNKKPGVYYMFINSEKVLEIKEEAVEKDEKSMFIWSKTAIKDIIGTSGKIQLGLTTGCGSAEFSDFAFTTDAEVINKFVPDVSEESAINEESEEFIIPDSLDKMGISAFAPTNKVAVKIYDKSSIEYKDGKFVAAATGEIVKHNVPCINFKKEWHLSNLFAFEDISPFLDDDKLYLYLKSPSNGCTYVVEMEDDWVTPKYDTFRCVLRRGYANIETPLGKDAANPANLKCSGVIAESIVEGPNMLKHNGEYFLTFSMGDYLKQNYAVFQAKSDSPFGPFRRVGYSADNETTGAIVVDGINTNNFKGTGHHCFVFDGKEWFNVYHAHQNIESFGWERYIHADRVVFEEVDGETILTTNGPSKSLQWLPEQASEYKNLASQATITVEGGKGAEYLNDGLIPFYNYNENKVFSANENVVIKLTFEQPVTIVSLMVFNSFSELSAFSKINAIAFELAEKSTWMTKDYKYAAITGLEFPTRYYDVNGADSAMYKNCASCVAEFNEITVKSITIAINKEDRIKDFDKLGNLNTSLNITEIAVLGR